MSGAALRRCCRVDYLGAAEACFALAAAGAGDRRRAGLARPLCRFSAATTSGWSSSTRSSVSAVLFCATVPRSHRTTVFSPAPISPLQLRLREAVLLSQPDDLVRREKSILRADHRGRAAEGFPRHLLAVERLLARPAAIKAIQVRNGPSRHVHRLWLFDQRGGASADRADFAFHKSPYLTLHCTTIARPPTPICSLMYSRTPR